MTINPATTSQYGNTAATHVATSTEKTADFSLTVDSEDKSQSKEQAVTNKGKDATTDKNNIDAALSELELETNIRQIKEAMGYCTDMGPVTVSTEAVNPDFYREYETKNSIYDIPMSELKPRLEAALWKLLTIQRERQS